jgi:hypothetical protein
MIRDVLSPKVTAKKRQVALLVEAEQWDEVVRLAGVYGVSVSRMTRQLIYIGLDNFEKFYEIMKPVKITPKTEH